MAEKTSRPNSITMFLDWLNGRRIVAISLAVALVIGVLSLAFVPRSYTATTTLLFVSRSSIESMFAEGATAGGGLSSLSMLSSGPQPDQWLTEVTRSRKIRQMLAEQTNLSTALGYDAEKTLKWLEKVTSLKSLQKGLGLTAGVGMAITVTCQGPNRLQQALGLKGQLSAEDAQRLAAELANGYVEALDNYITYSSVSSARDTRRFVEARTQEVNQQLERTEGELEQLQVEYSLVDPQGQAALMVASSGELKKTHMETAARMQETRDALTEARKMLPRQEAMRIERETTSRHPLIGELEMRLTEQRATLAAERASGKSAEHPDVVAAQSAVANTEAELKRVQKDVQSEVSRTADPAHDALRAKVIELEVSLAGAAAAEQFTAQKLRDVESRIQQLPPVARQYARLARQREMLAGVLTTLARRLEIAAIQEQQETNGRFEQLDAAVTPSRPDGAGTGRRIILTFLLSLAVLGLAWAYRRGYFQAAADLS